MRLFSIEVASDTKDWVDIGSALVPFLIALFVAVIAYRQWRTAENKRQYELFDRRYEFYSELERRWLQTSNVFGEGQPPMDIEYLIPAASKARLLFGKDGEKIAKHILLLEDKSHDGSPFFANSDFSEPFKKMLTLR